MPSRWTAAVGLLATHIGVVGCVGSCSENGSQSQSDSGTDLDTDSETETEIDTSWDGGPLIPCDGEPEEDEGCVQGGTYLMGCMPYDDQCEDDEKPMVEVALSPFFIDIFEVTNEQIIEFLNTLGGGYVKADNAVYTDDEEQNRIWASSYSGSPPIGLNGEGQYEWGASELPGACTNRTVESAAGGVSWLGAKLYCEWRGKRLPTEAEWEAAARGQTKWVFPCAWEHEPCWYGAYDCCMAGDECFSSACENCCIPFEENHNGSCNSPFGVDGMYGNAAEWILDGLDEDHSWCAGGCENPPPRDGEQRIVKGGDVRGPWDDTRISERKVLSTNNGNRSTGIRCVRSAVAF